MFRNDIIRVYSEDSSSGWWQLCNRAALEGDCRAAGKSEMFPGCRRRKENYLEVESDWALTPCRSPQQRACRTSQAC